MTAAASLHVCIFQRSVNCQCGSWPTMQNMNSGAIVPTESYNGTGQPLSAVPLSPADADRMNILLSGLFSRPIQTSAQRALPQSRRFARFSTRCQRQHDFVHLAFNTSASVASLSRRLNIGTFHNAETLF